MTPRLRRLGYQTYEIATGPATGVILRRSTNPRALPCCRWTSSTGLAGHALRGLAAAVASQAEEARK